MEIRINRQRWAALAALSAAIAIATWLYWSPTSNVPGRIDAPSSTNRALDRRWTSAATPPLQDALRGLDLGHADTVPPGRVDLGPDLTRLLHARDAYAAAVQAWQSGQPGGFFAAEALTNACSDALNGPWMSAQGFPAPVIASGALRPDMPAGWEGGPPQRQAARLAALQEAQARCSTLREHRRAFHEPHAADGPSRQLLEASAKLGAGGRAVSFGERRAWLAALDQSRAWLNPDYVMVLASETYQDGGFFEGQRWGGARSAEAYDRAVRLAGQAYGFDASAAQRSVATLAVCIRMGACEGRVEDLVLADLPADSPMRVEVLKLYPRIWAALRKGDIDAFAPPKPPRPKP
jgi:hypothetical protein